MIFTFPKIVKELLARFSRRDYQVLNTRLFFNANQHRDLDPFQELNQVQELYQEVLHLVKQKNRKAAGRDRAVSGYEICLIDSTVLP